MKKIYAIYIAAFLAICLVPSAGLLFGGREASAESADVAKKPEFFDGDGVNERLLADAGAYFEDNFAFRSELVTGRAFIDSLFGVSAADGVILGTDGWLYYKDSLEDYQGSAPMTDRQLFDVAHSMAMAQRYAAENGAGFVFAVAPNKNTLYGEYMPYYYRGFRAENSNLQRLIPWLEAEGVNYADLRGVFEGREETLYHKRDSHWDNRGAALAADSILSALEKGHASYAGRRYEIRRDHEGDLDGMLFPAAVKKEEEYYFDPMPQFTYTEPVESNFDPKITTRHEGASGSLVMYRDSFGNSLLPFMAEAYGEAYFSRAVPYPLTDVADHEADAVAIVRAERFLPQMASDVPLVPASPAEAMDAAFSDAIESLTVEDWGEYKLVSGAIAEDALRTDARIFLRIDGRAYEAVPASLPDGREGFSLFIDAGAVSEDSVIELSII